MVYKPATNLTGYICLVTGASKGIGKGIALALGECGATVYVTGRKMKSPDGLGLKDVAAEIEKRGGKCIPVACDHSDDNQVKALFSRIKQEQKGRFDLLVNNAYTAVNYILETQENPGKGYWDLKSSETPEYIWDVHNKVGLRNSFICATLATQMMIEARKKNTEPLPVGVIIQISSIGSVDYLFNPAYGAGKAGSDKMIKDMGIELAKAKENVVAFSVWPGPVKTEKFKDALGDKPARGDMDVFQRFGESPELTGRVISHLLSLPPSKIKAFNSTIVSTGDYGYDNSIVDIDNQYPYSLRSLKMVMSVFGYNLIAKFIPKCIKIPKFLLKLKFSIY